jgi:uncharacterized protein (DUF3084 family)
MSVILPPAAADMNGLTALLQIVSDPKAATARLNEIKQANAELVKNQVSLIENQRRAAELEVREERVSRREAAVAQREKDVADVARDLERREKGIQDLAAAIRALETSAA